VANPFQKTIALRIAALAVAGWLATPEVARAAGPASPAPAAAAPSRIEIKDLPLAPSALLASTHSARSSTSLLAPNSASRIAPNLFKDIFNLDRPAPPLPTPDQPTPGALPLGLDDAIDRGMKHNLQMLLDTQTERTVHGEILAVGNQLLPNMRASAYTNTQEINLAALGFKPSLLAKFGLPANSFKTILKLDTTDVQLSIDQPLINLPDFYLYSAAKKAADVATMNLLNTRGSVVQAVATQYLLTPSNRPTRKSSARPRSHTTPASAPTSTSSAPASSSRPSSRPSSAPRTPSPKTRSPSIASSACPPARSSPSPTPSPTPS